MTRLCVAVVVVAPSSSSLRRRRFVAHPPAHSRLGHPFLGAPSSPLSSLPPSRRRSVVVAASKARPWSLLSRAALIFAVNLRYRRNV